MTIRALDRSGDYRRVLRTERGATRGAVRSPRWAALLTVETLHPRRDFHALSLAASKKSAKMDKLRSRQLGLIGTEFVSPWKAAYAEQPSLAVEKLIKRTGNGQTGSYSNTATVLLPTMWVPCGCYALGFDRFLRMASPRISMRWALCTSRSRMPSANMGSPICSCHFDTGSCEVRIVERSW